MQADPFRRLLDDLARFPDSPTLNAIALRDREGVVRGVSLPESPLAAAWWGGADAALIAEAERLDAFVGEWGDRGYVHRAARLNRALRSMNRRLARFSGIAHSLGTVTVRAPLGSHLPRRLSITVARSTARGQLVTQDMPMGMVRVLGCATGVSPPPPMESAPTASLLRTGPPPSLLVRPRQAAPGSAASHPRKVRLALAA